MTRIIQSVVQGALLRRLGRSPWGLVVMGALIAAEGVRRSTVRRRARQLDAGMTHNPDRLDAIGVPERALVQDPGLPAEEPPSFSPVTKSGEPVGNF